MIVPAIVERFGRLESQIAQEKGDFALFALFMREGAPNRWDLIVSAPWAADEQQTVRYFVEQIKMRLGEQELVGLSRIVVVDPEKDAVKDLNHSIQVEHGNVEVRDSDIFGLTIKRAHFITSKRPPALAVR